MRAHVAIVLLVRVRIRIDYWLLAEHLPVLFVSRKTLEKGNLVLDLRLDVC